jgi:5,10-methylenetetrahydromethanopterin reductase
VPRHQAGSDPGGVDSGGDKGRPQVLLSFGTVLDDGEDAASPHAVAAAGPALAAAYHAIYEARGAAGVDKLPGGPEWREAVEAVEPARRHLAVHDGHLAALGRHDEALLAKAAPLLAKWTMTGTRADIGDRLRALTAAGITEVAYQPMGPDIPRELAAFAAAAGLADPELASASAPDTGTGDA